MSGVEMVASNTIPSFPIILARPNERRTRKSHAPISCLKHESSSIFRLEYLPLGIILHLKAQNRISMKRNAMKRAKNRSNRALIGIKVLCEGCLARPPAC